MILRFQRCLWYVRFELDLFGKMKELALKNGALEVLEGSNLDDEGDYRPGMRAIAELQIESPLRKADDAYVLDNSDMTIAQQNAWLMCLYNKITNQ